MTKQSVKQLNVPQFIPRYRVTLVSEGGHTAPYGVLRDSAAAAAALRRERVNRGRPPAVARDVLLHAVVEALKAAGLMPSEARHRADAILIKCRVPTPEESVARAARRGRGAISV